MIWFNKWSTPDFLIRFAPMISAIVISNPDDATKSEPIDVLVDTGASCSFIDSKLAESLGLKHNGIDLGSQDCPTKEVYEYQAKIIFPWGETLTQGFASKNLENIKCGIGRDVLRNWVVIYDGKQGSMTICTDYPGPVMSG